jgi:hypothetical protein
METERESDWFQGFSAGENRGLFPNSKNVKIDWR